MKVKVDREKCIGCGTCSSIAPKAFEIDDEMKAIILKKNGSKTSDIVDFSEIDESQENISEAAKSCPTEAIIITE